jgi:hypothetical protein
MNLKYNDPVHPQAGKLVMLAHAAIHYQDYQGVAYVLGYEIPAGERAVYLAALTLCLNEFGYQEASKKICDYLLTLKRS